MRLKWPPPLVRLGVPAALFPPGASHSQAGRRVPNTEVPAVQTWGTSFRHSYAGTVAARSRPRGPRGWLGRGPPAPHPHALRAVFASIFSGPQDPSQCPPAVPHGHPGRRGLPGVNDGPRFPGHGRSPKGLLPTDTASPPASPRPPTPEGTTGPSWEPGCPSGPGTWSLSPGTRVPSVSSDGRCA